MAGPDLSAAPVLLEESDLESIKYNVLVHLRRQLVENVDPRRFLTFLRSKYVIDERESDEIRSMRSRSASAEVFLDILATKGQEGYDEFCQAILHDQTQTFLLTSMNKTLEILKARVLEHKQKLQKQREAQAKLQTYTQQMRHPRPYHHPAPPHNLHHHSQGGRKLGGPHVAMNGSSSSHHPPPHPRPPHAHRLPPSHYPYQSRSPDAEAEQPLPNQEFDDNKYHPLEENPLQEDGTPADPLHSDGGPDSEQLVEGEGSQDPEDGPCGEQGNYSSGVLMRAQQLQ